MREPDAEPGVCVCLKRFYKGGPIHWCDLREGHSGAHVDFATSPATVWDNDTFQLRRMLAEQQVQDDDWHGERVILWGVGAMVGVALAIITYVLVRFG